MVIHVQVGDPHKLRLTTVLNGVVVQVSGGGDGFVLLGILPFNTLAWLQLEPSRLLSQEGTTETMIFKTEAIIAWISKLVTLKPGDVILTGYVGGAIV